MIVTVRRWTSIAMPRVKARSRAKKVKALRENRVPAKQHGFLDTFSRMYEHQVNLMFKDDLPN